MMKEDINKDKNTGTRLSSAHECILARVGNFSMGTDNKPKYIHVMLLCGLYILGIESNLPNTKPAIGISTCCCVELNFSGRWGPFLYFSKTRIWTETTCYNK